MAGELGRGGLKALEDAARRGFDADSFQTLTPFLTVFLHTSLLPCCADGRSIRSLYEWVVAARAGVAWVRKEVTEAQMSFHAVDGSPARRYSSFSLRFLIAMLARRARNRVSASASHVIVKPFVVMAARALGPGPTRLKLVKLAHNLSPDPLAPYFLHADEQPAAGQPSKRAA